MYLCVCKAVSERTVRRAVREEGAISLRELSRRYGIGTCCGKCVPDARALINECRDDRPVAPPMFAGSAVAASA